MKQLWLYALWRGCGIKFGVNHKVLDWKGWRRSYLFHQGKVRVCQRLWLANLEINVLEDQDDGKHGDDDNYNDDDEVVDYEDEDEEEEDDS